MPPNDYDDVPQEYNYEELDFESIGEGRADLLAEHYEATVWLEKRWQWWASGTDECERVDLRKAPLQYLMNIAGWMERHHSRNTPYKETRQYAYISEKIKAQQAWIDLAKKVLRGPKYTWQSLKTSR